MADDNNPTISDEEIVEKSPDQRFLRVSLFFHFF